MKTGRLEAFSDGVFAIVITIMVLELKVPEHGLSVAVLLAQVPVLLSYLLSYVVVAVIWVNHHHVFAGLHEIRGRTLWLNNLLLLTVSLIPYATGIVGRYHERKLAAVVYGVVMLASSSSFALLRAEIAGAEAARLPAADRRQHRLAHWRNAIGVLAYASSIPLAWVSPRLSYAMCALVAILYVVPIVLKNRR